MNSTKKYRSPFLRKSAAEKSSSISTRFYNFLPNLLQVIHEWFFFAYLLSLADHNRFTTKASACWQSLKIHLSSLDRYKKGIKERSDVKWGGICWIKLLSGWEIVKWDCRKDFYSWALIISDQHFKGTRYEQEKLLKLSCTLYCGNLGKFCCPLLTIGWLRFASSILQYRGTNLRALLAMWRHSTNCDGPW